MAEQSSVEQSSGEGTDAVLFTIDDHVATITLNRPEALNAMNRAVSRGIMDGLRRIEDDADIRVGIITGTGRAFCAGADLKERAQNEAGGTGVPLGSVVDHRSGADFATFHPKKPMIAAVNGYCLAGGMELALICDIRLASVGASFGLPEITRGFFPGAGGPQRLARAIPQALAMEMVLTGDPQRALESGLVSRVVAADELQLVAWQIASRIAGHAPLAVRAVKEVAASATDLTLAQSLRLGGSLRWIIGETDDAKEGPRAFAEKRDPEYRGP
jgi:enoyl-CoA hydratase/carnithine racemase